MNTISFNVTGGKKMKLVQQQHDGTTLVIIEDAKGNDLCLFDDSEALIPAGDFVMLVNYWHYVKRNDIQNDFINPNGANKEAVI